MIKRSIYLFAIPAILLMAACATNKTAQLVDQHDDVYYSIARAKEATVIPENTVQKQKPDYVSNEELYGDVYTSGRHYFDDYTSRIYRFRYYSPSFNYYNSIFGYNDLYSSYYPYGSPYNSYYPYSSLGFMFGMGYGYNNYGYNSYNYNPWRYYGYNSRSNFWGPYSYYNSMNPYGYGGYSYPSYTSPNYRSRPDRAGDNMGNYGGSVSPNSGGTIKNGDVIQSRGRAERYGDSNPASNTSGTRQQGTSRRPERVSQREPERVVIPDRISTAPRQDPGSQGGSYPNNGGGRSGGDSGGARPSRAN